MSEDRSLALIHDVGRLSDLAGALGSRGHAISVALENLSSEVQDLLERDADLRADSAQLRNFSAAPVHGTDRETRKDARRALLEHQQELAAEQRAVTRELIEAQRRVEELWRDACMAVADLRPAPRSKPLPASRGRSWKREATYWSVASFVLFLMLRWATGSWLWSVVVVVGTLAQGALILGLAWLTRGSRR